MDVRPPTPNKADIRPRSLWVDDQEISLPPTKLSSQLNDVDDPSCPEPRRREHPSTTTLLRRAASREPQGLDEAPAQRDASPQDPWTLYEGRIRLFHGCEVTLARSRTCKSQFVGIQLLAMEATAARMLVRTIEQYRHRSFPRLIDFLNHENQFYLVWEPVELSLSEVLASECDITENEIAELVWPVLTGIKFLRDQGRALVVLEPKNILLTEFGSVKIGTVTHSTQHVWRTIRSFTDDDGRDGITIAGVENSRPIEPPEPTAASLQLVSLASIVDSLLVKNGASHPWSSMIRELPSKLRERPIEELIKDPFFKCMNGVGELALLVKVVNKSAYQDIEFLH